MKGKVLYFDSETNSGIISGEDGKRYDFLKEEWKSDELPVQNQEVDFEEEANTAKVIIPIMIEGKSILYKKKDKVVAGVLAILLGGWGAHKFYLGYTGPALVYLLINTVGFAVTWIFAFIPNYILGIIALVEGIIYLTKSDEEFYETYVKNTKNWL